MKLTDDQKEKILNLISLLENDNRICHFPDKKCETRICAVCISENIIRIVEGEGEHSI